MVLRKLRTEAFFPPPAAYRKYQARLTSSISLWREMSHNWKVNQGLLYNLFVKNLSCFYDFVFQIEDVACFR